MMQYESQGRGMFIIYGRYWSSYWYLYVVANTFSLVVRAM